MQTNLKPIRQERSAEGLDVLTNDVVVARNRSNRDEIPAAGRWT